MYCTAPAGCKSGTGCNFCTILTVANAPDSDAPQVDASHAFAAIRAELARLRAGLGWIESEVTALEREHRSRGDTRDRLERYLRVLLDV